VSIAERDSPEQGLRVGEPLTDALADFHSFHATRAELLRAAGRASDAVDSYDRAIALASNVAEIVHLARRRDEIPVPLTPGTTGTTTNGESI